jgi:hypothetical protein
MRLGGSKIRQPRLGASQWLIHIILAIWETEIKRMEAQGQPRQLSCKITRAKWIGGVVQEQNACFASTKP